MNASVSSGWPWPARPATRSPETATSVRVVLGTRLFTIRGATHLKVDGGLVEIQRSAGGGYETIAVAGEDLLVIIAPAEALEVGAERRPVPAIPDGVPLD